jgi:hypothetical protein
MQIVVNHLTRMSPGYICVAGIDLQAGAHVRPVGYGRLSAGLLTTYGGPFDIGQVVDLGRVVQAGKPPEIEDYRFEAKRARRLRLATADEFWQRLGLAATSHVSEIFGPALTRMGARRYAVAVGEGQSSLGCLMPSHRPELYLKPRPDKPAQVRLRLWDGEIEIDAGVTDIRLYDVTSGAPDVELVRHVAAWLARSACVILSVGLSRPFSPDPDLPEVHWLQINNVHFAEVPLWQPAWQD